MHPKMLVVFLHTENWPGVSIDQSIPIQTPKSEPVDQPDLDLDDAHDTSQLTTVPHLMSPHNQPHYFISPRNQPHDIKTDHITTTAHHHHGTAEGCCAQKPQWGHRTSWSSCAHDRQVLSLELPSAKFKTPDRRWCCDAQGTPAGAQADPPRSTDDQCAQVKSTATDRD